MKCLRCGYCCIHYSVMIINPLYVKDKSISELFAEFGEDIAMHKTSGVDCPHLCFDGDVASCSVRKYKFYEETPCFQFSQVEDSEASVCRIGKGVKDGIVKLR